ncbi:hypothetical protein pb186bvf_001661 [Paramecium bursaria]
MSFETRQFISQSEANRTEKQDLVFYQRISAIVLFFGGIGNLVMLIFVNMNSLNPLTLGFIIVNGLIILLSLLVFIWCQQQKTYLLATDDEYGENTDNLFGRSLFFSAIALVFAIFVFLIYYMAGQQYLFGVYQSKNPQGNFNKYDTLLTILFYPITAVSLIIIGGLAHQLYCFYQLTLSQNTSRFNIYLLSLFISLDGWICIYILKNYTNYTLPLLLYYVLQILILLGIIGNAWRWRGVFLQLASFLACLIPIYIAYQALYVREYQEKYHDTVKNCQLTLTTLSETYVNEQGCSSKYLKDGQKYLTECNKNQLVQIWEKDIDNDPTQHPLGCINLDCCSFTANIFTKYLFFLIGVSLDCSLLIFALILFQFHVANRPKGERTLGKTVEIIFIILYTGIIVLGILILLQTPHVIPVQPEAQFDALKVQKAKGFTQLTTSDTQCQSLTQLTQNYIQLSTDCKDSSVKCPLNQNTTQEFEKQIIFALWIEGSSHIIKEERTIFQDIQSAQFLFSDFMGNVEDFFAVIGEIADIQSYINDLKICFKLTQANLNIHIYQNTILAPIGQTSHTKHQHLQQELHNRKFYSHFAGTPTTTTTSNPSSSINPSTTSTSTPPTNSATNSKIPNCQTIDGENCKQCKEGFAASTKFGCLYQGNLKNRADIQVSLTEPTQIKVTGKVIGQLLNSETNVATFVKLSSSKVCWDDDNQDPICVQSDATGTFEIKIPFYQPSKYSAIESQPQGGQVIISSPGFDTIQQSQAFQYQEIINLGTFTLINEITFPQSEKDKYNKALEAAKQEASKTDKPAATADDKSKGTTAPTDDKSKGTATTTDDKSKGTSGTAGDKSSSTEKPSGSGHFIKHHIAETAKPTTAETAKPTPASSSTSTTPSSNPTTTPSTTTKSTTPTTGGTNTPNSNPETAKPVLGTNPYAGQCTAGEYQDSTKKCKPSNCKDKPNCLICDTDNKCLICYPEFSVQNNNTCAPSNGCIQPFSVNQCNLCLEKDTSKCEADQCDIFSWNVEGKCQKQYKLCDLPNCQLCSMDGKCAVCAEKFKQVDGACKPGDFYDIFIIDYMKVKVQVVDSFNRQAVQSTLKLYQGNCGSTILYGTQQTDENGIFQYHDLFYQTQYSLIVSADGYNRNCYEFEDTKNIVVPLAKNVVRGQQLIVLEWQNDADLDLMITFNPLPKLNCITGFFNNICSGTQYGTPSDSNYKFESILIKNLVPVQYLIFVQNLGDKDKSLLIESQAKIKYYVSGKNEPAAIFQTPFDLQDPKLGTEAAYTTDWVAWLVGCIDASKSEIPQALVTQNGIWWTQSLSDFYPAFPRKTIQNFPSPKLCSS